ncbi:MAG: hypothetical protein JW795_09405 [Chitinivibrionales bacterium]|nr:hypothetical protein [Chitinivibrionales bacterium]
MTHRLNLVKRNVSEKPILFLHEPLGIEPATVAALNVVFDEGAELCITIRHLNAGTHTRSSLFGFR